MSSPRHRAAPARPAASTWFRKILGPAVVSTSLTAMVVGLGVAGAGDAQPSGDGNLASSLTGAAGAALSGADLDALQARGSDRASRASRTAKRVTLQPQATDHRWATAPLNVWTGPGEEYKKVGLVEAGTRLAVTGQVQGHWAEVLLGKNVRWVNDDYLANKKPQPETATVAAGGGGISGAPCPDGSAIESGLTTNADILYRAVCAAFPQPTSYGGYDPHGEHVDGRAIDIMISGDVGWQIANWLRANASALKIRDIIYAQRIWTPERAGEGWRYMSDRGSVTANHYDHVHVAVY